NCIFCKILKGDLPSVKLFETDLSYSFLDISPLSQGHALVIPKYHAVKMHQVPDEYLTDVITTVKKVARAINCTDYNILQVTQPNVIRTFQEVEHVHFHIIPKPSSSPSEGLVLTGTQQNPGLEELKRVGEAIRRGL
ncbi:HIT-like domain-containing protein, partial [Hysterangium stoloniferum]